ncbi:hypothetical protein SEVIR_1G138750v4 [Setaria viridis]
MACFKAAAMSLVVVVILAISAVVSAEAAAVVDAPSPAPPVPLNLTEILTKDTQYNAIIRLLKDTEVTSQVTSLIGSDRNADGLDCAGPDRRGVCGAPVRHAQPDGRRTRRRSRSWCSSTSCPGTTASCRSRPPRTPCARKPLASTACAPST